MIENDFETLDRVVAERTGSQSGLRRWLRAYLIGLLVLLLAAVGVIGYVTVKHPPPPGISMAHHLKFSLGMLVQELGHKTWAFQIFLPLAKDGHPDAQSFVGYMYEKGSGVGQDPKTAAIWYQEAADKDHAVALNNLAALYLDGRGVPQDRARAVALYQKAARAGDAVAQTNLGRLYMSGNGVPRIYREALIWFRQAAEQGHGPAMYFLGQMHRHGWGLAADREEARNWFEKAAAAGSQEAEQALAHLQ